MLPMSRGGYGLSLCAMKAKCRDSHWKGRRSNLMAAPLGKGVIAANVSKSGSDTNRSPVRRPLRLLGCFLVTVLDGFSKAGGMQEARRGITLFLMHLELQPASLRKPLLTCLAFSYLSVLQLAKWLPRLQYKSLSEGNAELKLLRNEKLGQE